MPGFFDLLRKNKNYRYAWMGQVISEIGDHFNNIAVFSLAVEKTGSGMVVTGVMLSRAIPVMFSGPVAGVVLDRLDRKRVMIASDLVRAVAAMLFILTVTHKSAWLLYLFSGLLMFASPYFTSGRASILPAITSPKELHTANSLTQTTQWATLTLGTMVAGFSVSHLGYEWAFFLNSMSFAFSAWSISRLKAPDGRFQPQKTAFTETQVARPWHEYAEGLRYMRASPLIFGIALLSVGWASGGGAAQILFSLFGEIVFRRGAAGIGVIWSFAGVGLLVGGTMGHWLGRRLNFEQYKRTIIICYIIHGGAYIIFSLMEHFWAALVFIALSRAAIGVSSVLNFSQLLRHVSDAFRGRVFATIETLTWSTMMLSMTGAGIASEFWSPRIIGVWSGALSSSTALFWAWAHRKGRLPQPPEVGGQPDEVELHGEPTI
jgi:MFS family permease